MTNLSLFVYLAVVVVGVWGAVLPGNGMLSGKRKSIRSGSSGKFGIYHGKSADVTDYPYVASVTYMGVASCTGVIVSNEYVLTTADCIDEKDVYYIIIEAGANEATSGGQQLDVWSKTVHPEYDSSSGDYNFGLLQMDGAFSWDDSVQNVSLPGNRVSASAWLSVVGYGSTEENDDNELMAGKMAVVSNRKCESLYKGYSSLTLTNRMGCVYNEKKTTVCDGDFGAPLVRDGVLYHLAASVATTGKCSSSAYPVVTADVYSVVSWIRKTIKNE